MSWLMLKICYLALKTARQQVKALVKDYDKSEYQLQSIQSAGQIIGEVFKQLDEDRCKCSTSFCRHCPVSGYIDPKHFNKHFYYCQLLSRPLWGLAT